MPQLNPKLVQVFTKQTRKVSVVIIITVAIVLSTSVYIKKQAQVLTTHRQQIGELSATFDALDTAERQLLQSQDAREAIADAFINVEDIGTFIQEAESLANRSGMNQAELNLGALNEQRSAEGFGTASVPVTIRLQGNMSDLAKYIEGFERLPFFAEVISFSINASASAGWTDPNSTILVFAKLYVTSL